MKVRVFTVLLNVYFHDFDRIFQDLIYITLRSTSNFNYNLVHYGKENLANTVNSLITTLISIDGTPRSLLNVEVHSLSN